MCTMFPFCVRSKSRYNKTRNNINQGNVYRFIIIANFVQCFIFYKYHAMRWTPLFNYVAERKSS